MKHSYVHGVMYICLDKLKELVLHTKENKKFHIIVCPEVSGLLV